MVPLPSCLPFPLSYPASFMNPPQEQAVGEVNGHLASKVISNAIRLARSILFARHNMAMKTEAQDKRPKARSECRCVKVAAFRVVQPVQPSDVWGQ